MWGGAFRGCRCDPRRVRIWKQLETPEANLQRIGTPLLGEMPGYNGDVAEPITKVLVISVKW